MCNVTWQVKDNEIWSIVSSGSGKVVSNPKVLSKGGCNHNHVDNERSMLFIQIYFVNYARRFRPDRLWPLSYVLVVEIDINIINLRKLYEFYYKANWPNCDCRLLSNDAYHSFCWFYSSRRNWFFEVELLKFGFILYPPQGKKKKKRKRRKEKYDDKCYWKELNRHSIFVGLTFNRIGLDCKIKI